MRRGSIFWRRSLSGSRRLISAASGISSSPNDIGDFQTGAITHQGLTPFGAEVIEACHRLGFVCDVAHATEETVKQAVKVATKPLLLSHAANAGMFDANLRPVGLYVEQGRELVHANIKSGRGNFT
jgi:hypothetical protein